ncbi:MAG TPA: acyl-CoA thioesterase [Bdellovibrionales bacterium]|nr:acyl-CoA thioesterase [Bdellovibrionales bacterium]
MSYFTIRRRVVFYETDAMGVVHHSNYFRFFEEARGAWVRENGLADLLWKTHKIGFAVIEAYARYAKPAAHNEEIDVRMQVRREGIRYRFQYNIVRADSGESLVTGVTVHVPLSEQLKPCRVPAKFNEIVEASPWTETWP